MGEAEQMRENLALVLNIAAANREGRTGEGLILCRGNRAEVIINL